MKTHALGVDLILRVISYGVIAKSCTVLLIDIRNVHI